MLRVPSLTSLRAFEAVARLGSLTKASRELLVTPAAVSHRIGDLEARLGRRLFHRRGKSYELTPVGLAGFRALGDAFERLGQALAAMERFEQREDIRVTAVTSLAVRWILPRLRRFEERHKGLAVSLEASDDPLVPGEYDPDILVAHAVEPPDGRAWQLLLHDRLLVLGAPALLDGLPPLERPADLAAAPLIHVDWREMQAQGGASWRWWFAQMGVDAARLPHGIHVNQAHLALELATAGRGLVIVGSVLAEEALREGRLAVAFDPASRSRARYWLLEPGAGRGGASGLFRQWLLAEARDSAQAGGIPAA